MKLRERVRERDRKSFLFSLLWYVFTIAEYNINNRKIKLINNNCKKKQKKNRKIINNSKNLANDINFVIKRSNQEQQFKHHSHSKTEKDNKTISLSSKKKRDKERERLIVVIAVSVSEVLPTQ